MKKAEKIGQKWAICGLKTVKRPFLADFDGFLSFFGAVASARRGMRLAVRGRLKPGQRTGRLKPEQRTGRLKPEQRTGRLKPGQRTGRLTPGQRAVSPGRDRGEIR
ncbi:MAG: hypothetical protein EOM20_12600 [Spartobacteria bacterium]|nr:hypothetical protein [Spartobacteria bacterium]